MSGDPDLLGRLVPRPRRVAVREGAWTPGTGAVTLEVDPEADGEADREAPDGPGGPVVATAVERLRRALERHGLATSLAATAGHAGTGPAPSGPGDVRLLLRRPGGGEGEAESYRLAVAPDGVTLEATDAAGLLHATATLAQWLAVAATAGEDGRLAVPTLQVDDAPDFRHRGVLLDVSRDKVPRMATLRALVRWLSGLKVNQLQLYTEHTFAYRGHEEVWRGASPITPEEVLELDALCRRHAMELVPNQNSFGHFHRWLTHPAYRPLAECPDGVAHPWAHPETGGPAADEEPFSLCATDPGSLHLLADLYGQLLPCFTSRQLNAGLDEAFDLGRCRSREECEERGRHRVYLDFLGEVARLARAHGRSLQFWGDILLEQPELAGEVPDDAVALVWGHEPGHPFAEHCAKLAGAGVELHVCPGTSAWSSLGGRLDVALANTAEAAAQGHAAGASGYLLTDWGDFGHLQPLPVSLPGLLAGAAAAWNSGRPVGRDEVAELVALHAFADAPGAEGLARALVDLGTVHQETGAADVNGTALFQLLLKPARGLDHEKLAGLTREGLETARKRLAGTQPVVAGEGEERAGGLPDGDVPNDDLWHPARAGRELAWVAAMLDLACRIGLARFAAAAESDDAGAEARLADLATVPARQRRELAADLQRLLAERRTLWLDRNRPGGLDHAFAWLGPLWRALTG